MAEPVIQLRIQINGTDVAVRTSKELETAIKNINVELGKTDVGTEKYKSLGKELAEAKVQQKNLNAEQKEWLKQAELLSAPEGSMKRLRIETSLLVAETNELNLETAEGTKKYFELAKVIDDNKTKIRDFDRQLSGNTELVGEYSRGILNAFTRLGLIDKTKEGLQNIEVEQRKLVEETRGLTAQYDKLKSEGGAAFEELKRKIIENNSAITTNEAEIQSLRTEIAKVEDTSKKGFAGMKDAVKDFGKEIIIASGLAFGIGEAFAFVKSSVDEAVGGERVKNSLKNSLENIGKIDALDSLGQQMEELSDKFKFLTGDEITDAQDKLVQYGKVGIAQIQELLPVIIDYSAKSGKSITEATDEFIKGLNGQGKGLKLMGVELDNGGTATENFGILMDVVGAKVKGAAEIFQNEGAGAMASYEAQIKESKQALGDELLPVIAAGQQIFLGFLSFVKEIPKFLREYSSTIIALTGAYITYESVVRRAAIATAAENALKRGKAILDSADLAITNLRTIATTAYGLAVSVLTGQVGVAAAAQRIWNATIAANPAGALLTVVLLLGTTLAAVASDMGEVSESMKVIGDVSRNAAAATVEQEVSMRQLLQVARDENASKEERIEAIRKLNEISPEYLGNLTLETINTEATTKAVDEYIASLRAKAREQALSQKEIELERQKIDVTNRSITDQLTLWDKVKTAVLSTGGVLNASQSAAFLAMENQNAELKKIEEQLKAVSEERKKDLQLQNQKTSGSDERLITENKISELKKQLAAQQAAGNDGIAIQKQILQLELSLLRQGTTDYYAKQKEIYELTKKSQDAQLDLFIKNQKDEQRVTADSQKAVTDTRISNQNIQIANTKDYLQQIQLALRNGLQNELEQEQNNFAKRLSELSTFVDDYLKRNGILKRDIEEFNKSGTFPKNLSEENIKFLKDYLQLVNVEWNKHNAKIEEINANANKKRRDQDGNDFQDLLRQLDADLKTQSLVVAEARDKELTDLQKKFVRHLIGQEEFEREKARIVAKYAQQAIAFSQSVLSAEIAAIDAAIEEARLTGDKTTADKLVQQRQELNAKLAALGLQMVETTKEQFTELNKAAGILQNFAASLGGIDAAFGSVVGSVGSFIGSISQASNATEGTLGQATATLGAIGQGLQVAQNISNLVYQQEIRNNENLSKAAQKRIQGIQKDLTTATGVRRVELEKELAAEQKKEDDLVAKKEQIKRDEFNRQKTLSILQIGISTAVAAMQAFAQLGPIGGAVAAGVIAAIGLAEIALVASKKYARGGYTGASSARADSTGKRPAGIVHENEWVAPEWMNSHPFYGTVINQLEGVRSRGFADGGFTSGTPAFFLPPPNVSNVNVGFEQVVKLTEQVAFLAADAHTRIDNIKVINVPSEAEALLNRQDGIRKTQQF